MLVHHAAVMQNVLADVHLTACAVKTRRMLMQMGMEVSVTTARTPAMCSNWTQMLIAEGMCVILRRGAEAVLG
jgi:hypothetical protein